MSPNMEITSKEMIKPSSPTPNHLRNHKLCSIDQIALPCYIPLILFYELYHPKVQESLKKSLSDVLTEFYPLAGRFCRDKNILDCNDLGALFVECKVVGGNLLDVITDPVMDELHKYMPAVEGEEAGDVILAVQINHFDCGGVAVAVKMHHKVGDGNSAVSFLNAWAAASRGDQTTLSPRFDMADVFPPKDMFSSVQILPLTEKVVTKRLVLDKKDLENLKLRESKVIKDPTRVEAISSFLMKHFREASRARGSEKKLTVFHAVNLRPRISPPLPSHAFGNVIYGVVGSVPVDDDEGDVVEVLRNEIRKIDGDFVKEIQNASDVYLDSLQNAKAMCLKEDPWFFSSWTRFPFYEIDYGWGRPTWVIPISHAFKNVVVLMSSSSGDGIEAWVNLLEEDAAFIDFSL